MNVSFKKIKEYWGHFRQATLRKFAISKAAWKELLREVFQTDGKWPQKEDWQLKK